MPPLPFHARLLEFRHRNIMTAGECSRLFGVSYATYSSWENGRREANASAHRLLAVFEVVQMFAPTVLQMLKDAKETT